MPFLDRLVGVSNENLIAHLYVKPTDCHYYLELTSSHLEHIKKLFVYSQLLPLSRICSFEKDFNTHEGSMRSWFLHKNYQEGEVDNEIN